MCHLKKEEKCDAGVLAVKLLILGYFGFCEFAVIPSYLGFVISFLILTKSLTLFLIYCLFFCILYL